MGRTWFQCAVLAISVAACGSGSGDGGVVAGIYANCNNDVAAASVDATSATLTWDAISDARVAGYRVYYGTGSRNYAQAKGAGVNAGGCTTYVVTGLDRGRTYYFAVTAYDASGNESDFSNEASKAIP
jgi:fibronectin type 3 domain-containing protein